MGARLLYSLIAAAVTTGVAGGLSAGVRALPKGPIRDNAEKHLVAPGRAVMDRLDSKDIRKLRKKAKKQLKKQKERLEEAAEDAELDVDDLPVPEKAREVTDRLNEMAHLYNVSVWAVVGFGFCFLGTLVMGVSSFKSALALGFKVTLLMVFLQGAFVIGAYIAWQGTQG